MSPEQANRGISRRAFLAGTTGAALLGGALVWRWVSQEGWLPKLVSHTAATQSSAGGVISFDFGKVWFGNLSASLSEEEELMVTLRMGEKLDPNGRIDRLPPGTVRYHEATVLLGKTAISPELTETDMRGMESYGRPVMPFRYVEVEGLPNGATDVNISLEAVVDESFTRLGALHFSGHGRLPEDLNRLVELGMHTMEATSFMGIFVDGDRERLPYEADSYINQVGWYVATDDPTVPRRTLKALFEKPTWPSEWMVHLIFIVWADYRMTGDTAFLEGVIDRLSIFSLAQFIDASGLVTTLTEPLNAHFVDSVGADYLEDIVDWPQIERDGYEMVPYNTVVNSFVCEGQRRLAELYSALGRQAEAAECHRRADSLQAVMIEKLIDPADGLFVDGLGSRHKSAHASFIPLAFGITPERLQRQAVIHLEHRINANENGFPCSVYAAQYLLEALFKVGEADLALALTLNPGRRGWLNMLNVFDATITHEAWDPAFKENLDWTHAWGAAFLNLLQRKVLGVQTVLPGWDEWTLRPFVPDGLSINAVVPTRHGVIRISLNGQDRSVSIDAPSAARFKQPEVNSINWRFEPVKYRP